MAGPNQLMRASHNELRRRSGHRSDVLNTEPAVWQNRATALTPNRITESHMRNKIVVSMLVAASSSFAAPVFASGYGPAPFYNPADGAPASQRGQSAQTLAVEARESYGGAVAIDARRGAKSGA